MRLRSGQTFKVVSWILRNRVFSQTGLAKEVKVSWGLMNKVVQWLVKKGFVRKSGRYELVNMTALIQLLATEIELEKQSFEVNVEPKKILAWIKKNKQVLCLSSALQFYSNYFRDPSINVYYSKELVEYLKNSPSGLARINLVKSNLDLFKSDIIQKKGFLVTDEIRTIIDLFADKKAYATEPLLKRL